MKINEVRKCGEETELSVNVRNAGKVDGDAVVQIYVDNPSMKELVSLKEFRRVTVPAGNTVNVVFRLPAKTFAVSDTRGNVIDEPGKMEIIVADMAPVGKWKEGKNVLRREISSEGEPVLIYKGIE